MPKNPNQLSPFSPLVGIGPVLIAEWPFEAIWNLWLEAPGASERSSAQRKFTYFSQTRQNKMAASLWGKTILKVVANPWSSLQNVISTPIKASIPDTKLLIRPLRRGAFLSLSIFLLFQDWNFFFSQDLFNIFNNAGRGRNLIPDRIGRIGIFVNLFLFQLSHSQGHSVYVVSSEKWPSSQKECARVLEQPGWSGWELQNLNQKVMSLWALVSNNFSIFPRDMVTKVSSTVKWSDSAFRLKRILRTLILVKVLLLDYHWRYLKSICNF